MNIANTSFSGRIHGVAFDLDGVVVNSPAFNFMAWSQVFLTRGITVSELEIHLLEGGKDQDIARHILSSHGKIASSSEQEVLSKMRQEVFSKTYVAEPVNGILDFINELVNRRYYVALVTGNVRSIVDRILKDLSLGNIFNVIITGDTLISSKPDPEPYGKAFKALNLNAEECLVIENAPAGIESAKRAGAYCAALATSLPVVYLEKADFVFLNVNSLRQWFFANQG